MLDFENLRLTIFLCKKNIHRTIYTQFPNWMEENWYMDWTEEKTYYFFLQIYYIVCPEVTVNFARFPSTPTGKEIVIIEQATGTCVSNAEVVGGTPTYLCKGDGKWTLPTGGCKCKAGFQPDMEKQTCNGEFLGCLRDTFQGSYTSRRAIIDFYSCIFNFSKWKMMCCLFQCVKGKRIRLKQVMVLVFHARLTPKVQTTVWRSASAIWVTSGQPPIPRTCLVHVSEILLFQIIKYCNALLYLFFRTTLSTSESDGYIRRSVKCGIELVTTRKFGW